MATMHQVPDGVAKELAAKLRELQGSSTDAEMGKLLGITRVSWLQIRSGRRNISYAVAKRAALIWPELGWIVVRDWTPASSEAAS